MAYRGQSTAAEKREYEFPSQADERYEITALPENKNVKRGAKKVPYFKYSIMALCMFAMLLCVLYSNSRVAELTLEADAMRAQLDELKSEGNALNAKREQKYNLAYVEQMAVTKLGMVKQDKNQIVYLSISNPDKVTVASAEDMENGSGIVAGIVKSFNAVVEYLN